MLVMYLSHRALIPLQHLHLIKKKVVYKAVYRLRGQRYASNTLPKCKVRMLTIFINGNLSKFTTNMKF